MSWQEVVNSVSIEREVEQWDCEFTEHWTFKNNTFTEETHYKLRVVGPNGESCKRQEIEPENVPEEVREKFLGILLNMSDNT